MLSAAMIYIGYGKKVLVYNILTISGSYWLNLKFLKSDAFTELKDFS